MKKIATLSIALGVSLVAMAIPAKRGGIEKTQANGETITIYLHGDEYEHWTTNGAGERIELGEDGNYHVVDVNENENVNQAPRRSRRVAEQVQTACPLNIAPRGLVILVNFQDKAFITSYDEMHEMINGENYTRKYRVGNKYITSQGSARQYFIDQSWGQYQPQFDVVGPYTVSKNMSYYGGNDWNGNDKNPHKMIIEACQLADADGVDFTLYDNNNDGDLDFVYVIYAGYGEADGGEESTIWPHTYWVRDGYGESVRVDGKYINSYACGNELNYGGTTHDGIGTFCHEFSHVLGLPDLYNTNSSYNTKLMGYWDILDAGSYNNDGNTPPAYSAYERFFLGWLTPTQITGNKDITLHPLSTHQCAALIATTTHNLVGNDPNPTTFYLLENRPQEGWDKYLPGKGLLLTKIQYSYSKWTGNTVNNNKSTLGVDIIEADGKDASTYYDGKAGDAFPSGAFEYTKILNYAITNIGYASNNRDIEFRLNDGGFPMEIGEEATAIDELQLPHTEAIKMLIDGQVIILRDGHIYNVMGTKLY